MLNDMENAIAFIENQDLEIISNIKDSWHLALEEASKVLKWPDKFIVEYNPAIWRISHHPVGIRLVSSPWGKYLIFEFATPNSVLPFDCFPPIEAKTGVMVHEIAHLIDDQRWGFDLRRLAVDSFEYVTREQRAELLGFAGYPLGIFEANKALIESTVKKLGVSPTELGEYLRPLAAVETLGRIGMGRSDDLVRFYADIETFFPVHKILEEYLATNVFSLAGLTTAPSLNNSDDYGIKKSKDLASTRIWLCEYLKGKIGIKDLEEKLGKLNYKVKVDSVIQGYNPISCLDFKQLSLKIAKKNITSALHVFLDESSWKCFGDLRTAMKEIDIWLKTESTDVDGSLQR